MLQAHRHGTGIARREFLQVGFSGFLGLGLPGLLASRSLAGAATPAPAGRAKAMILVFLTGGPSHLDTFDPKPDAPEGIRGEFQPIETAAPGVRFCEHLPGLARHADTLAVVRSLSHRNLNHLNSTHLILTGRPQPGAFFDKIASRDDYPCYASTLQYARPRDDGIPGGVLLPTFLMEGPLIWPGQHAGFLGPQLDPWQIRQDPNQENFKVDSLALPEGFSVERLEGRRALADQIGRQRDLWDAGAEVDPFAEQRRLAYSLLLNSKVAQAFEIDREPAEVRDRYGRHMFGQSILLARRLVEAGVPIVQANMGRVQNWDTHGGNFRRLKSDLLPPLDRGVSALLDDLAASGRLDETLVVIAGEFGRTPRIGKNAAEPDGRDHWGHVFSAAFAGAGVVGGQVVGQSDRSGAYPGSNPYSPGDFAATIYRALGVPADIEARDRLSRPIRIVDGEPIEPLYTAATA